jgi:hypothetical protein
VSFLNRVFIDPNIRSYPQPELASILEDTLFHLNREADESLFPRSASSYLDDWASDGQAWLRKYYPHDSDVPHYDLTPAAEQGIGWLKTWLETAYGRPYTNPGFGNAFKDWCREADLPRCTAHGLRKGGAVRAAEAGVSEHELMAMFGWEDAAMARVYTRKAAQKRLEQSGAAKLLQSRELSHPLSHHQEKDGKSTSCDKDGGHARNRTGVRGFAEQFGAKIGGLGCAVWGDRKGGTPPKRLEPTMAVNTASFVNAAR